MAVIDVYGCLRQCASQDKKWISVQQIDMSMCGHIDPYYIYFNDLLIKVYMYHVYIGMYMYIYIYTNDIGHDI